MTVIEVMRDAAARRTALLAYARAHDKFSELEQANRSSDPVGAEVAHVYAVICLRAYRAELDNQPMGFSDEGTLL